MESNQGKRRFSWLLFGGLRMRAQEWPWPSSFLDGFWRDLEKVYSEVGPFDAVFFTGDLARTGQKAEYAGCSRFIGQLLVRLEDLGAKQRPALFFVPGNHDMLRSSDTRILAQLPDDAWKSDQIDEAYLRRVLWNALEPYDAWAHQWRFPRVNWGTFGTHEEWTGFVYKT